MLGLLLFAEHWVSPKGYHKDGSPHYGEGFEIAFAIVCLLVAAWYGFHYLIQSMENQRREEQIRQDVARWQEEYGRLNDWDRTRKDRGYGYSLTRTLEEKLKARIFGPKVVELNILNRSVALRRSRLHYESLVTLFIDDTSNGFDVEVPALGFRVRVTSDRAEAAPWDLLLATLCKIDRSVIHARGSKSQPLTHSTEQEPIPSAKVTVIDRPTQPLQSLKKIASKKPETK